MYQRAGVMKALTSVGLHGQISELCGLSSGAITSALYSLSSSCHLAARTARRTIQSCRSPTSSARRSSSRKGDPQSRRMGTDDLLDNLSEGGEYHPLNSDGGFVFLPKFWTTFFTNTKLSYLLQCRTTHRVTASRKERIRQLKLY